MASTKYVGKTGSIETPTNTDINGIKSWTLDQTVDVVESTSFDDLGVGAFLGAVTKWSGSFEGYKTGVPIVIDGSASTITLNESSTAGQEWSGACILTGISVASSHDGLVTYSFTFQGTGELTEPTA